MQRFDQRLNLVLEHAWHKPFTTLLIDLVECEQRHINGYPVFGVTRLVEVSCAAVHATQAQNFRKRLARDTGRFMPH